MPHLDELYRSARRMLADPVRAQDLVQDVYLRAWRSFHTFDGGNCRAWLYKILVNCVHDERNRVRKAPVVGDSEEILERQEAPPPVRAELSDEEILVALDELPEAYRDVVLLADVQEFSYKEIAAMLDIRMGTVMSRLSRGRAALRERLAEQAGEYGIGSQAQGGPQG
ncbi:MAG: sigma-70 family RNA polymerase sigma factor [Acidobacteria bacterium]|nr:sigma-70 family RNA polymerase sigma factor [Acidobacteriota bacterium]